MKRPLLDSNSRVSMSNLGDTLSGACLRDFPLLAPDVLCRPASDVTSTSPVLVSEQTCLADALAEMRRSKAGCVIVADDQRRPQGIFTERDLVLSVVHRLSEVSQQPIAEFMTTGLITATVDSPLAYLLTIMSEGGVRNLPLVDASGAVVGLVTVRDIVDFLAGRVLQSLLDFPTA